MDLSQFLQKADESYRDYLERIPVEFSKLNKKISPASQELIVAVFRSEDGLSYVEKLKQLEVMLDIYERNNTPLNKGK